MEKYGKYEEHLGVFGKDILADILPFSVVAEYVKLLDLLKFYNKNVEELNRYQSIQERFLCRLDKVREAKNQKVKKNRLNELSDEFLNNETRTLTIEEKRKMKEIDIFIDVYSEHLRRLTERKQEERKQELKRKEAENKYEEVVKKYNKVENEILSICENIFRIIRKIKKQINICMLKEQQLNNVVVKEIHKEKIKALIREIMFFVNITPSYKERIITEYIDLFILCIALKKCLCKEELLMAKQVVTSFEQRPISLEPINLELIDLNIEDELIGMICKFKNCTLFTEEQQENIIGNILQDINEWTFMVQACLKIADGLEVEENIEVLNGIKMENRNIDTAMQTNNSLYLCARAFKNLGERKLIEEEHRSM